MRTPKTKVTASDSANMKQSLLSAGLSNEDLMNKIHKQLEDEKLQREQNLRILPEWMKKLDWNKLIESKLFNNPKI